MDHWQTMLEYGEMFYNRIFAKMVRFFKQQQKLLNNFIILGWLDGLRYF
jgi:hypothetical protein